MKHISHLSSINTSQCHKVIRTSIVQLSPHADIRIARMIQKPRGQFHQYMLVVINLNGVGAECRRRSDRCRGNDGGSLGEWTGCEYSPLIFEGVGFFVHYLKLHVSETPFVCLMHFGHQSVLFVVDVICSLLIELATPKKAHIMKAMAAACGEYASAPPYPDKSKMPIH